MTAHRNLILYSAAAVVALAFAGDQAYRRLVETPLDERERTSIGLEKRVKSSNLELRKAKRVVKRLPELENRSLPANLEMARSRYQAWLLDLIGQAGWESPHLDSGEPIPYKNLFHRLSFSVQGRGSLDQITQFLYGFYRAGHLHRIRSVTLTPVSSSEKIDASLAIDALVLPGATSESELSEFDFSQDDIRPLEDYQIVGRRNVFRSGGGALLAQGIVLSAVTSDVRGRKEAWFKIGGLKQTRKIVCGEKLAVQSLEVELLQLSDEDAIVQFDGRRQHMTLGQSLADARDAAPED